MNASQRIAEKVFIETVATLALEREFRLTLEGQRAERESQKVHPEVHQVQECKKRKKQERFVAFFVAVLQILRGVRKKR